MREKVFLRDWYYNAGIIGFLRVLYGDSIEFDDKDKKKLKNFGDKLEIGENYIEFDLDLINDFKDKFYKQLFLKYFDLNRYQRYIQKRIDNLLNSKQECTIENVLGNIETSNSYEDILDYKEKINSYTKKQIYDEIKPTKFFESFVESLTKGIITLRNSSQSESSDNLLDRNLKKIEECDYKLDGHVNKKVCAVCQERKSDFIISNSLSNIIGFNSDNINWIWGFNAEKAQVCPICSLIYLSASVGLIYQKYGNFFYFVNHNKSVSGLIKSYTMLELIINKETLEREGNTFNIYPVLVKESVKLIMKDQAKQSLNNITFIEVQLSSIQPSQGTTRNYNIYSFSLSKKLAKFISESIEKKEIPKGYYAVKNSFDIEHEILKKTIERKLSYGDIDRYTRIYLLSQKDGSIKFKSNINKTISYILSYMAYFLKGGGMEKKLKAISWKGFNNGEALRKKLNGEKAKISGIVHQFLNDLKIGNKKGFMDRYFRVCLTNNIETSIIIDILNDKNVFLHFGYGFINGLLKEQDKEQNQKQKEKQEEGGNNNE